MPRTLVHIAYHKTASSWFQQTYYPRVTNYRYVDRLTARRFFLYDHVYNWDPTAVRARMDEFGQDLILCDEDLGGNFNSAGLMGGWTKEVAERIARVAPEAHVVIFLREQVSLLASIYQQYIREGGTHGPDRYFHPYDNLPLDGFQPAKVALFDLAHFHYPGLIKLYRERLGADRVHVFLFEEFKRDPLPFLARFNAELGLETDLEGLELDSVNVAYRRQTLALARFFNHFTWKNVVDKRYWMIGWGGFPYSRPVLEKLNRHLPMGGRVRASEQLGPALTAEIKAMARPDNRWLRDELGLPVERFGYSL